ncbi:ATP-binding protein [Candidatus Woesearchaeota archaeon]|nr:ATP-binding protein [Candidatus Woesearchaeota archaeon]
MILGRIIGKVTTTSFQFLVEQETKKLSFVQVLHEHHGAVLCQVAELVRDAEKTIASCFILGYVDERGRIKGIMTPFEPGTEVLIAEDKLIQAIITLGNKHSGAYVGKLEGKDIPVFLDLNKLLTKHVAVLAKSGSGKSYIVGTLLEEMMEKKIPLLIIDPHGEYGTLREPNENSEDKLQMHSFGITQKGYEQQVKEFGDPQLLGDVTPLRLDQHLTPEELLHILPTKLSNSQRSLLYNAMKQAIPLTLTNLLFALEQEESSLKYTLISVIDQVHKTGLFSLDPTPYHELVQPGRCSILNMKGTLPEFQEIIAYKILKDLFEERKKEKIPPFFTVIEEAHAFMPERSFGEAKSSKILRSIASEGRKFGFGLCVISQRPARIDKNILSQCTTQIILKVTNPQDLRAIMSSVEGITVESEETIKNLAIGQAMITGIVDMPLVIAVRPRRTKHGGEAIDILEPQEETFAEKLESFTQKEYLPIIKPKITPNDLLLMTSVPLSIRTVLVPVQLFVCEEKGMEYQLLVEMMNGTVLTDIEQDPLKGKKLPPIHTLTATEMQILKEAFHLKTFSFAQFLETTAHKTVAREHLTSLVNKQFLILQGENYTLNDEIILTNLSIHQQRYSVHFQHISYDEKLMATQNIAEVMATLARFTTIKDHRDSYLVHYQATPQLKNKASVVVE